MSAPLPICHLNGVTCRSPTRKVSPLDRAFLFGDAVYEVIPVYGGRPFRLREHLDRLNRSLAGIRMTRPGRMPSGRNCARDCWRRTAARESYIYFR